MGISSPAAQFAQQRRERRLQQHEQRGALLASQFLELAVHFRRDRDRHQLHPRKSVERSRPVGGQRQFRRKIGQLAASSSRSAAPSDLPHPPRCPAAPAATVCSRRTARPAARKPALRPSVCAAYAIARSSNSGCDRPAVRGAVVDQQQQCMLVRSQPKQRRPEGNLTGEVEAVRRRSRKIIFQPFRRTRHSVQRRRCGIRRQNALPRTVIAHPPAVCAGSRAAPADHRAPLQRLLSREPCSRTPTGML